MTDEKFTGLLPVYLQKASRTYFTPVHIARIAAHWLTEGGKHKVLDIGAGVGKFCIVGAAYTGGSFYGVEYRPSLARIANDLIRRFEVNNAIILNKNVIEIDFSMYDAFYFFNPFYENMVWPRRLNNEVKLSASLYSLFAEYTESQLENTRKGTRLVTYHGNNFEVPSSFSKVKETENGLLKLWMKQ